MTATLASRPAAAAAKPSPTAARRGNQVEPLATSVVTLLTVVTAIGFCRIFPDWAYLQSMVVVCVGVHLASAALRGMRVPGYIAVPIVGLLIVELLALVYYRDTTSLALPSSETIEAFRADLRLVWEQFPRAVAPVPSEGSFAVSATALLAVCSLVADAFAFRAFGRAEAIVPTGVVFVFTSALGSDRNRVAAGALWVAVALFTVAVLRFCHAREETAWLGNRRRSLSSALPAAVACALIAGVGAGLAAPRLPGAGDEALLDTRNRDGDVTQVVSPLVDIRSRLVNKSNVEYFIVSSAQPSYWRVAGLSKFDGTVWTPSDQDLQPASGNLLVDPAPNATTLAQTVTISNLTGNFVPAAYSPLQVTTGGLWWAPSTQTLVVPNDGYHTGQQFNIISAITDPSPDELRAASTNGVPDPDAIQLPSDFPDEIRAQARGIVAGAATPYDAAILLQNFFRDNFTYDTDVQRGHSDDAMRNFLRIERGYCEQFAGTFTAMARAVGLPARVAVGYTQGELQSDGKYHVAGRHSHAWSEIWFQGYGWVLFDPTPGRGAPGQQAHTGVQPGQDETAAGPGTGPGTVTSFTPATSPTPTTGLDLDGPLAGGSTTTSIAIAGISTGGGSTTTTALLVVLGLVAGAVGWVLFMPRIVRRSQLVGNTAADRVLAAWQHTVASVRLAGAPAVAGATPVEYARDVELATGVDRRMIGEIARHVTRVVYSARPVDETAARRCEQLQQEIDELVRERIPWTTRLMSRIDPRIARMRLRS